MPFIRVSYLEDKYKENELQLISQCIMRVLIRNFNVPENDYFQVFHAHKPSEFFYSKDYLKVRRTDHLLFIQISLGAGRSTEQKRGFYKGLAEQLFLHCRIDAENVFVVLLETELEDWTFGKGLAQMIDDHHDDRIEEEKRDIKPKRILSNAQETYGKLAPAFAKYTDNVLFGDLWRRENLSLRERSLITVSALVAGEHTNQLPFHLLLAKENGISEEELIEVMTHLAFYAGWPKAASALQAANAVFYKK